MAERTTVGARLRSTAGTWWRRIKGAVVSRIGRRVVTIAALAAMAYLLSGNHLSIPGATDSGAVLRLEFAGTYERLVELYSSWGITGHGAVATATKADFFFIVVYTLAISVWCWRGSEVFRSPLTQRWAKAAAAAVFLAAACDVAENIFLLRADAQMTEAAVLHGAPGSSMNAQAVLAFTLPKWLILLVAVPMMLAAMGTSIRDFLINCQVAGSKAKDDDAGRLAMSARDRGKGLQKPVRVVKGLVRRLARAIKGAPAASEPPADGEGRPPDPADLEALASGTSREPDWRERAAQRTEGAAYGICFSGGGIRSGTFGLGALQQLMSMKMPGDDQFALQRAAYMSSVSGGGYLAGAHRILAHQRAQLAAEVPADALPADDSPPLARGSAEEDFIRRHGRYIADTPGQWIIGVSRVLVGLVMNLLIFTLVLFLIGRPLGWALYSLLYRGARADALNNIPTGVWFSIGGCAVVGLLAAFGAIISNPDADASVGSNRGGFLWRLAGLIGLVGVVILVITVGVPLMVTAYVSLAEWVGNLFPHTNQAGNPTAAAAGTATVTTIVGGVTALATVVTFRGQSAAKAEKKGASLSTVASAVPRYGKVASKFAPRLAGVGLLILAFTVMSVFAYNVPTLLGQDEVVAGLHEWQVWTIALVAFLLIFLLVDQTSWSLHPVYKRRLSSAFAIRPTVVLDGDGTLCWRAEALPFEQSTAMTEFMTPLRDLPDLVMCAVANVSGQEVAPPGRRAVTFTFEHDLVGGPQTGWTDQTQLARTLGPHNQQDATVMAAMAMSGAAFASAMGRESHGAINAVLTVLNLRLGVWLPSPDYQHDMATNEGPWVRRRHLGYLFKELFDLYSLHDRFLYVTDGGHLENLGLVELLRRRCQNVFCFDASGDSPTFPTTLAQAIELAEEQLPVRITFPAGALEALLPGSVAAAGDLTNDPLLPRYGRTPIAVGTITYTDEDRTGRLVFARATMTPKSDPFIKSHAHRSPRFPNDSTGDQFFSEERFDAYLRLGREIGEQAINAMGAP